MATTPATASGFEDLALTLGGRLGSLPMAVAYQAVLARALGPGGRGTYEAALLFGSMLILVFNFGSEVSSLYMISSRRVSAGAGVANGLCYALVLSLAAIVVGCLLILFPVSWLGGMFSKGTGSLFVLGLFAGQTSLLSETVMAMIPALKRFRLFSAMLLLGRASGLVLLVLLVWLGGRTVAGALHSLIWSRVLVLLVPLALLYWRWGLPWERPRLEHLRELFAYGSRYYAGKLSNTVNVRIGPLVLLLFATREELGFYGQALAIALNFMILPDALFIVLLPRASEDAKGKAAAVAQAGRFILASSVVALAGTYFFGEFVFRVLLSEAFLPSVPLFKVLVLGFAFRAFGKTYEPYLIGTDRPGRVSIAVAVGVAVNVVLLFVLMPRFGLIGAAWSLVGNYASSTLIIVGTFLTASGVGLGECLVPVRDDLRLGRTIVDRALRRNGSAS